MLLEITNIIGNYKEKLNYAYLLLISNVSKLYFWILQVPEEVWDVCQINESHQHCLTPVNHLLSVRLVPELQTAC